MAGTITGTLTRVPTQQIRPQIVRINLTCTADAADGSYPSTTINSLDNISDWIITGLKLYSIKIIPDVVIPPTNLFSMTILDDLGVDLLGSRGIGIIPTSGPLWIPCGPDRIILPALILGDIFINISDNEVNSAILTVELELIGE